jgi:predicted acyltransferase
MKKTTNHRLLSLDFLRGLTVAAMVLVNNPGSWATIYAPLKHAEWNGCTPTDLIAPFFLFIVGVSIVFSIGNQAALTNHHPMMRKACRRALILFGLGLFLALYPNIFTDPLQAFQNVRIPGVLQRIAVVYFMATIIFLKLSPRSILKFMLGLLVLYWVLMSWVPVPDIGYANLEKGTNLGAWIDRCIFTEAHLWKAAKTWDPEGLLSTISAIATSLLGVLTGILLRRKDLSEATKTAYLFVLGALAVIVGLIWGLNFPINKSLWTSSYVLYTGGLAMITLALCYWLIDVKGYKRFTKPAVVFGVNAMLVFFISGLLPRTFNLIKVVLPNGHSVGLATYLYKTFFTPYFSSPFNASLAWAIAWVLLWMSVLWVMYNRRIFRERQLN